MTANDTNTELQCEPGMDNGHLVEASTRCPWNRVTVPGLHTENIDPGPDPTRSKLLTR